MLLGIDFGTSFSQIATMYLDQPLLLLNPGEYGIPSEFYYDRENGILIGQDALDAGQGYAAANLVSEVKMAIIEGKSFKLDGRTFTAKEIVKEIYRALVTKAIQVAKKRAIDTKIEGVVISVPAKFGVQERALIREACEQCLGTSKVPVKKIIKEPVAAAIAYHKAELENNKYLLVYDLGGGTCDVALVRADSSAAEHYVVVDSDMLRIGGRNWDEELIKYIMQRIEVQSGIRIQGNAGYEEKIRRAAISAKHDLSDRAKKQVTARVEINGRIYPVKITRAIFDEITSQLLCQTFECLQEVYDRNCQACKIDEIICVGGSSNMPQVEEGLMKLFPQCTIRLYEPEHAVVNGAAIYASMKGGEVEDIANFSYGTDVVNNYGQPDSRRAISNIIFSGTKLPTVCSKFYHPIHDGAKSIAFDIYESTHEEDEYDFSVSDKRLVGEVCLTLPPNATKTLNMKCVLKLNTEGMLEVEASEPSGKKVVASFQLEKL